MKVPLRSFPTALFLCFAAWTNAIPASAASCEKWNTNAFFRDGGIAELSYCLTTVVDPNTRNRNGQTPLHRAARWSKTPTIVTALVQAGADPNARNDYGSTPLHYAAKFNKIPAIVAALVKTGAKVNTRNKNGWTPLHHAARRSKTPAVVTPLVKAGAEVNALGKNTWTPLHQAARYSETPGVVILLKKLKPKNRVATREICRNWNTKTFFQSATVAIISNCIKTGANVNAQDRSGWTPLHYAAAFSETPAILMALLNAGADPAATSKAGETPWDYAKRNSALKGLELQKRLMSEKQKRAELEKKKKREAAKKRRIAKLQEERRSHELIEKQRKVELEKRKKRELAEKKRRAELAERKKREVAEKRRQAKLLEERRKQERTARRGGSGEKQAKSSKVKKKRIGIKLTDVCGNAKRGTFKSNICWIFSHHGAKIKETEAIDGEIKLQGVVVDINQEECTFTWKHDQFGYLYNITWVEKVHLNKIDLDKSVMGVDTLKLKGNIISYHSIVDIKTGKPVDFQIERERIFKVIENSDIDTKPTSPPGIKRFRKLQIIQGLNQAKRIHDANGDEIELELNDHITIDRVKKAFTNLYTKYCKGIGRNTEF